MSSDSESTGSERATDAIADTGKGGGAPQRPYRCANPDEAYEDDGVPQANETSSVRNADDLVGGPPPYMITVWLPGDEPARLPLPPLTRFTNH